MSYKLKSLESIFAIWQYFCTLVNICQFYLQWCEFSLECLYSQVQNRSSFPHAQYWPAKIKVVLLFWSCFFIQIDKTSEFFIFKSVFHLSYCEATVDIWTRLFSLNTKFRYSFQMYINQNDTYLIPSFGLASTTLFWCFHTSKPLVSLEFQKKGTESSWNKKMEDIYLTFLLEAFE